MTSNPNANLASRTTADGWISRADFLEVRGCSESTARRLEKEHRISVRRNAAGRAELLVADLKDADLIPSWAEGMPGGPGEAAELLRLRADVADLERELARAETRLETRDEVVVALQARLAESDRQAVDTARHVRDLIQANRELVARLGAGGAR